MSTVPSSSGQDTTLSPSRGEFDSLWDYVTKLQWEIVPPEEVEAYYRNRCTERRGPRSTVKCEEDVRHHAEFHAGRGERGQWFTWPMSTEPRDST